MGLESLITIGVVVGAFIGGILLAIFPTIKDKFWGKSKKNAHLNPLETLARDVKIQDMLAELRVGIRAERVYVSKFHNGEEYFDGTAIKKVSKTHETCMPGVSHEILSYQNVLTSLIPGVMEILSQSKRENKPIVRCTSSLKEGFLKNHLLNVGIKTCCKYRIVLGDRLIGYLGVHFKEENCDIGEERLKKIKEAGGTIENIFATDPNKFNI